MLATTDEVVELELEVPPGEVFTYDHAKLCSALGINDLTRVVVETDGLRRALVTIYPGNPLTDVRAVTREDLVMDRSGRYIAGSYHNGRPARKRLYDPRTGSAQRFLTFGTTGAGKSRAVQIDLITEKINRIVSWVCDLKNGQSMPEARGNVDWFATLAEAAILMLTAGVAVSLERMTRYSAMGRTAFLLGRPDPLLHIRIAEANRLLDKGSPYRDQATYLIREIGRTGRSVGVGVGLDAQAAHLEELGGSDTLRAMLKEGEVTLLRWSGSMMRQLVADGLLPAGAQLTPIPKTLRPARLVSQFDAYEDDDDAPGTQGMGYLLCGPHPTALMRHHRIGSVAPLPGLDPEILALYGDDEPARLELDSWEAAGDAYACRDDARAMAVLCATVQPDPPPGTPRRAPRPATAAGPAEATATEPGEATAAAAPVSALLTDRILAVLEAAEAPMTTEDVLAVVNQDGGREVKLGSIRNALRGLVADGAAARTDRGLYAVPAMATT